MYLMTILPSFIIFYKFMVYFLQQRIGLLFFSNALLWSLVVPDKGIYHAQVETEYLVTKYIMRKKNTVLNCTKCNCRAT